MSELVLTIATEDSETRPKATVPNLLPGPSLIDLFLREQQQLTAVDRFAQWHEQGRGDAYADGGPAPAIRYQHLMPASPPRPGEQYAFEVDLDACSGCKACVTACHTLNGLDPTETWRDVGLLHGGSPELPVLQHVTAACHHCLDPACMNGCPVRAYEKDPATGIVRHLDDQCIGCQYCVLACPYEVPKYNARLGIVRKCDMCSSRLAVGEAPACVQACPNQAIRIAIVRPHEVIENCETGAFLPGAPEPSITLPTTHYKTARAFPRNMLPADYYSVRPEHAHRPLVLMLVLTQLSVGAFLIGLLLQLLADPHVLSGIAHVHAVSALLFGLLALGASIFHLGRPRYAFRAVIGLRTSWLSREIVAFGVFAVLAAAYATTGLVSESSESLRHIHAWLGTAVLAAGLCGLVCSVMIYQCTQRSFWNGPATGLKFLLTTLTLGIATTLLTSVLAAGCSVTLTVPRVMTEFGGLLLRCLIGVSVAKLLFEAAFLRHLRDKQNTLTKRSAMLMTGDLCRVTGSRFGFGLAGGVLLPGLLLVCSPAGDANAQGVLVGILVAGQFAACVAGELLERYLFFAAAVAPRMPGRLVT